MSVNAIIERLAFYRHLFLTRKLRKKQLGYWSIDSQEKVALIIGNGPSIDLSVLERLNSKYLVSFCCNRFYLAYPATSFRPEYTVLVDKQMVEDFGHEIHSKSNTPVFCGDAQLASENKNSVYVPISNLQAFKFRNLAHSQFIHTGSSVVVSALQVAFAMGYRSFFLLGVDHSIPKLKSGSKDGKVEGDGFHFISDYRSKRKWYPPDLNSIDLAFDLSCRFIKEHKGSIFNLTPNTQLETVPRASLEQFPELFDGS